MNQNDDSVHFHTEILRGFILGILLGLIPLIVAVWLFRQDSIASLISDTSNPIFYLFWIGTGVITALLVTSGFALSAWVSQKSQQTVTSDRKTMIPATGKQKDENDPSNDSR